MSKFVKVHYGLKSSGRFSWELEKSFDQGSKRLIYPGWVEPGDNMVGPDPNGSKGRKRSEGQARLGAIFVWSSVVVMMLSIVAVFSFFIFNTGSGLTEDDFRSVEDNAWSAEIEVSDFATISGTVGSVDGKINVKVTIFDPNGDKVKGYDQKTPVNIYVQIYDSGSYEIQVEILDEGKTIDDLDISISAAGFDVIYLCCGTSIFGIIFIGLIVTGFILLLVAISTRRREMRPPRPLRRYPPPPPPYYGMGYPGRQMYQPPPSYPPFRGYQNEGDLGYDGPPRVVRRGRYDEEEGAGRW